MHRAPAQKRRTSAVLGVLVTALLAVIAGCTQTGGVISAPSTPSQPQQWSTADIGKVQINGTLQSMSAAEMKVTASGANIWGTADSFYFVYEPFHGNVDVKTYVKSLERTDGWSKAGVMVRNGLGAGAMHAYMDVTPDGAAEFIWRSSSDGISRSVVRSNVGVPAWVRVVREGSTLTGYVSKDGTDWTQVGSAQVSLANATDVGLAVTSHDASQSVQTTVASLTAGTPGSVPTNPPPPSPQAANWICPQQPLSPAYQPTYYVSTTGSDSNDGRSASTPFRTLQRAANAVGPGDVVWIRGGVYSADV